MDSKTVILLVFLHIGAIQVYSNDVKTVYTRGYSYSQFFPLEENLSSERILRFSVRTPSDAQILLAPSHQADGPVYEIVLGAQGNTVNYIRGRCPCQEEPSATIRTVNLLSFKEFRDFWVKIKTDGRRTFIQVGMGDKDTPFQEWRDPRPLNPQYLSFRSGTAAVWRYGFSDSSYTKGVSPDKHQAVVTSTGFGQYYALSNIVSHSEDGITLYFTARTGKELQILLSPAVSYLGDIYEVGIRDDGAYVRRRHLRENKASYKQNDFVDDRQRLQFWIKLTNGSIALGRGESSSPLLQWMDPDPLSPQFVSFTLHRERGDDADPSSNADVQYGLGPEYTLNSKDCTPRWRDSTGKLPPGALRGGRNDKDELYVCRANHEGNVIPGSYVPGAKQMGECHITQGTFVYKKSQFQVLTGCRFTWVPASLGEIPSGAILASASTAQQKNYVSRNKHEKQIIIGRLQSDARLSYIPFNDQELPFTNYEVLVQGTPREAVTAEDSDPDFGQPLIG